MPRPAICSLLIGAAGSVILLTSCGLVSEARTPDESDVSRAKIMKPAGTALPAGLLSVAMESGLTAAHRDLRVIVAEGRAALHSEDPGALQKASLRLDALNVTPLSDTHDVASEWKIHLADMGAEPDAAGPPMRGRIKGPAYRMHRLGPGESEIIDDLYYAAEDVEMSLSIESGLSVSWEISADESAADPICWGPVDASGGTCRFVPLWTSRYRVEISNPSGQEATYLFVTN